MIGNFNSGWIINANIQIISDINFLDVCQVNIDKETPVTNRKLQETLNVLRRGVQRSKSFEKHYKYDRFIQELLHKNKIQSKIDDYF
ncbi:hypothetical protein A3Q56_05971 [Intoshia linei]|uniref:Uncharacterized protein n=1 Tax=Intoshia linei TaxID=1819745 RepID=A0A177AWE2_9BILA|nr:hypothetical protein A3Q56_05971 [Intoshia linei]